MPRSKSAYHHGNLQEALIETALEVIAEGDVASLSLRELARRLGVSYAAPYHHFQDKSKLLGAIAKRGFEEMAAELDQQLEKVELAWGQDAHFVDTGKRSKKAKREMLVDRLCALGVGYISFAVGHPIHYQVMFRGDLVDPEADPQDEEAESCFARLLSAVADLHGCGMNEPQVYAQALVCWSTVHGFATLWNHGAIARKYGPVKFDELAEMVSRSVAEIVG